MSEQHDAEQAIGRVTHYFSHLSVAAVSLTEPLAVGERIHIRGHTSNVEQTVESMEVDHAHVDRAGPGDDVALKVDDHVRDHDLIFREPKEADSSASGQSEAGRALPSTDGATEQP